MDTAILPLAVRAWLAGQPRRNHAAIPGFRFSLFPGRLGKPRIVATARVMPSSWRGSGARNGKGAKTLPAGRDDYRAHLEKKYL
jgi:hypothetical protein